ncbi:MAG TPA: DUF2339 domain-containing protein [Terriglobales bacterium]|nr:DUF2339 domain-containing protein [Terriglobales bacterium]
MADFQQELLELQRRVAELTQRIYKLEKAAGIPSDVAVSPATKDRLPVAGIPPTPVIEAAPSAPTTGVAPPPQPPPPSTNFGSVIPASQGQDFFKDLPAHDLESVLGGQWLNRIGIAALLIGAAYFLKLAFDNGWIGPSGRVAIGLIAGIGLVIWAERIHRRGHKYFAYSLTSVGVGIMYLSLWASFQLYHLVPGAVAFVAMIAVTASTAMIAVRKDAQILAAVALSGGFATPTLLSTGENRPVELFSYLLMFDIFAVVLASFRPWRRLLGAAYLGTIVYYFGWAERFYAPDQRTIATVIVTTIFALFAGLPLLRQLQDEFVSTQAQLYARSKTVIAIAVFNPIIYFGVLYSLYEADYQEQLAWVAIALAAIYIALSRQLDDQLNQLPDEGRVEKWLHLALGLGFLTLAIPIKLDGHWITMGWLIEAGLLLAVGHRARIDFLKYASLGALALGVVRLLFIENFTVEHLLFNWRFVSYLTAIAVFAGVAWMIRQEHGSKHQAFTVALVCINVLALIALNYEVAGYFDRLRSDFKGNDRYVYDWGENQRARDFTYSALWMLYGSAALIIGFWRKLASLRWQALMLIGITIAKVFLYDLSNLTGIWRVLSFIALGALLIAISFLYQKGYLTAGDEA